MKVSAARFVFALGGEFRSTLVDKRCFNLDFSRESAIPGIFDHAIISGMGKRGNSVALRVGVAVVAGGRQALVRGLSETEHVFAADEDQLHGFTEIQTLDDAKRWELLAAELAKQQLPALSERARNLLLRTEEARIAVTKYEACLPDSSLRAFYGQMLLRASKEEQSTAQYLAGVCPDEDPFPYELAGLLLARYESSVELNADRFGSANLYYDYDVLWRIHLLADYIMRRCEKIMLGR